MPLARKSTGLGSFRSFSATFSKSRILATAVCCCTDARSHGRVRRDVSRFRYVQPKVHPFMVTIWLRRAVASALVMVLVNCNFAPTPQTVSGSPPSIPPGAARIWYYRTYEPYVSCNLANVVLNGARIRPLTPDGPGLYLDVTPGNYRILVENYGVEASQSKDLNLAPGQEVFVKIVISETFLSGGGGQGVHRDAFFLRLVSPSQANDEIKGYAQVEVPEARRPPSSASTSAIRDPVWYATSIFVTDTARRQIAPAPASKSNRGAAVTLNRRDLKRTLKQPGHRKMISRLASYRPKTLTSGKRGRRT